MAQLIVRNIDRELVQEDVVARVESGEPVRVPGLGGACRAQEGADQAVAVHPALGANTSGLSLKEMLEQMPDLGDDEDFERSQDRGRTVEL